MESATRGLRGRGAGNGESANGAGADRPGRGTPPLLPATTGGDTGGWRLMVRETPTSLALPFTWLSVRWGGWSSAAMRLMKARLEGGRARARGEGGSDAEDARAAGRWGKICGARARPGNPGEDASISSAPTAQGCGRWHGSGRVGATCPRDIGTTCQNTKERFKRPSSHRVHHTNIITSDAKALLSSQSLLEATLRLDRESESRYVLEAV